MYDIRIGWQKSYSIFAPLREAEIIDLIFVFIVVALFETLIVSTIIKLQLFLPNINY